MKFFSMIACALLAFSQVEASKTVCSTSADCKVGKDNKCVKVTKKGFGVK